MFVGAGGVGRVVQRTVELMREHDTSDVTAHGGVNLDTIQRYLNQHYSLSLDLFGSETSTNAANYFAAGLKGRFQESERDDDHRLQSSMAEVPEIRDGQIASRTVPALTALNSTLQGDYIADCQKGVDRWNRILEPVGARLELPHVGFNRAVGTFAGVAVAPDGTVLTPDAWESRRHEWLPGDSEREHVRSLMTPVTDPGRMAGWIAPPSAGIHQRPVDFEYVRA